MPGRRSIWLALLVVSSPILAEETPVLSDKKVEIPKQVRPEFRKELQSPPCVVEQGGKPFCNVWLRSKVPATNPTGVPTYDKIPEGEWVGVIEIPSEELVDFKKQNLKPGIYTLRIAGHPRDGNHMGVAPFPEFLCLVPAEADQSTKRMPIKELMKASKESAETGHPGVLFLHAAHLSTKSEKNQILQSDEEYTVLQAWTTAVPRDGKEVRFPFCIVLVGASEAG